MRKVVRGAAVSLDLHLAHPLLLGGGIPFLRPIARRVALALVEARPMAKGCVFMRYRPAQGLPSPG